MSNPTSNFNWQMPTATDLVTDLPADFEVFGQAVDSSMADLLGGTTGQILAKNSNTNMDFVWITNDVGDITAVTAGTGISGGGTSGAVTITNSMATEITAKADLIVGTGNAAFDNLPVGANGTVLTADSTVSPTGLKWATPAGGKTWTLLSTTAMSGSSSITVSGISNKDDVLVLVVDGDTGTANDPVWFRINGDTGSNYNVNNQSFAWNTTYSAANFNSYGGADTKITFGTFSSDATSRMHSSVIISGCASTGVKAVSYSAGTTSGGGNAQISNMGQGVYNASAAVTNITVLSRFGNNFSGGNVLVYVA